MLYCVGPILCDTFPFEVSETEETVTADFAKHDLIGTRRDYEFSGPGDENLTLSGQLLPYHEGGMSEIELAKSIVRSGAPQFVMRGDGYVCGWYQLMKVSRKDTIISPSGVGFVIQYQIELERIDPPEASIGAGLIGMLVGLFG